MAEPVAETTASQAETAHPVEALCHALESRISRHEAESALLERQQRELSRGIEEARVRVAAADAARRLVVNNPAQYTGLDVAHAFDAYHDGLRDLALAEQRFNDLADRRAWVKEQLNHYRADLEMANESAGERRLRPADEEAETFRNASRQVFQIIEEERTRIARDMHDGPAQSMSNLVLQAEILERLVDSPGAILGELQEFKGAVRKALEETRQLIFDLRPMTLDDLGLVPTLRKFIKEYGEKHGLSLRFNVVGQERRLPGNIEGTLFRIIQEALTNVQRHARAHSASVTLNLSAERVLAIIRDDGRGFDVVGVEADLARNRNLGLISMRERTELERGRMALRSQPGKGTEVRVEFRLA